MVHEFAHAKVCEIYDIQVYEVVYFQFDDPLGYVRFERPEKFSQTVAVAVAPFLINTGIALITGGAAMITLITYGGLFPYLLMWLSFSIAARAIPSYTDTENIWERIFREWKTRPVILIAVPLAILLYVTNMLRVAFVEIIYGATILIIGLQMGFLFV